MNALMKSIEKLWRSSLMIMKFFCAIAWIKIFGKKLIKQPIWVICEKMTEARDNGYHLFVYIRKNHPEIPAYYIIEKNSADYKKIKPYNNIIFANTLSHFIYYICALYNISSQPSGIAPEPKRLFKKLNRFVRKGQHAIFLQHGIIKDELTHSFDYSETHYSLFVCSSALEKEFVERIYKYPTGIVQNLGLCRFDNLLNSNLMKRKQILIMPTFRKWLLSNNMPCDASEKEKESFMKSEYYIIYHSLLNDNHLQEFLRSKKYEVIFYPHYAMQPYIQCFSHCGSDVITIADRYNYDVQDLLIQSCCLITDFSSVFFDYAYMGKPEVFFQFDEDRYRSTHYKKGYFDYRNDGFGPVFEKKDQVISYLKYLIENECKIEDVYLARIHTFFDRRDNHNCERTFNAINKL